MQQAPKVSVIIPTYNYSSVLHYAIATVLWQTFRDFELIVIGDCCTDDSEQVVKSFGDVRIRWLNLAINSGSKAVPHKTGIDMARGKYVAYLEQDDLWHPSHLETVVSAIEQSGADVVHSVAVYVPPPGDTQRLVSGVFPDEFGLGHALVHSSVIHRKELADGLGAWRDYRTTPMSPDHLFWTRVAETGKRVLGVPKLTTWRFNASSRPDCYLNKRADEQARYFELLRDDPALAERELIEVARSAMLHGLRPLEIRKVARDEPPGSYMRFLRQIRGLEPLELMEPLTLGPEEEPFRIEVPKELQRTLQIGQAMEIEVQVHNDSDFILSSHGPHPVHFAYHWLHLGGSIAVFDGVRSQLIPPLEANSSRHYIVTIDAPAVAGSYQFQPALVQEQVRWFDHLTTSDLLVFDVGVA